MAPKKKKANKKAFSTPDSKKASAPEENRMKIDTDQVRVVMPAGTFERVKKEMEGAQVPVSQLILELRAGTLQFEKPGVSGEAANKIAGLEGKSREFELKILELTNDNHELINKNNELLNRNKELEGRLNLHSLLLAEAGKRVVAARNIAQAAQTKEEAIELFTAKIRAYEQWLLALSDESGDCTFDVTCYKCRATQKAQDKVLLDALRSMGLRR